jgi:hypothetical protein
VFVCRGGQQGRAQGEARALGGDRAQVETPAQAGQALADAAQAEGAGLAQIGGGEAAAVVGNLEDNLVAFLHQADVDRRRARVLADVGERLLQQPEAHDRAALLGLELAQPAGELERQPGARIEGVLVQSMESGLAEAIVGYRDDPLVGPTVLVGAGGTLAEIYRDTQLRLAPVTEEEAAEMVARVKGFAVLRGYRGLPRGDLEALAKVVAKLSRLALLSGKSWQLIVLPMLNCVLSLKLHQH